MKNRCAAKSYVCRFYSKYKGRIAIGVGYSGDMVEVYPLVFQNEKNEFIGIIAMNAIQNEERNVYIYHIGVFKTKCGNGSLILKELCDQADKFNVSLKLSPIVMPNGKDPLMTANQLKAWYMKFGFQGNSGLVRNPLPAKWKN